MKKIIFIALLFGLPALIFTSCTPVPTPEVEIVGFSAIGTYIDSATAMSSDTSYLVFDDTKLVVTNYVKAIVDGAYINVYQVLDTNPSNARFIRRGDVMGFTTQEFGQESDSLQDTLIIKNLKADITPEAESLWVDKNIMSYRIDLHFTGEDAYGKHKRFDVYRSVSILRALK